MNGAFQSVGLLAVAVAAVPLVFVLRAVLRIPFRSWLPILCFLAVILLVQALGALGGDEMLKGLVYLLAGVGRP